MNIEALLKLQGTMFLFMIVGFFLRKKNYIPQETKTVLTELVLDIILPCNIITSFYMKFDSGILYAFITILIIAILVQFLSLLLANVAYKKYGDVYRKPLQYATVCSNAGFLGTPIVQEVYGIIGVMYASIYLIPQRVFTWSVGLSFFTGKSDRRQMLKRILTNPCMVSVYFGIFLMITGLRPPGFLGQSVNLASGCLTPISMVLIGTILAEIINVRGIIDVRLALYSFIRLLVIPFFVWGTCKLFSIDKTMAGVSVILSGMPAPSATSYLSAKYSSDFIFATECVVFSTILSLFTTPIWCLIL